MTKRAVLAAALLLAVSSSAASAAEFTGTLNGSNYYVVVPDSGWNGTLVVLAHGIRDLADHPGDLDNTSPGLEGRAAGLAASGYAAATTSYRKNGWAVKEALADLPAIAEHVKANFLPTRPLRTLLYGESMGGLTTLARAERGGFDGHLAVCAPGAGAPRLWDWFAAYQLAHQVAFGGLPAGWGTVADIEDDVDSTLDGVGATVGSWLASFANFPELEFARLVSDITSSPSYYTSGIFTNFSIATEFRGELERRAGGPVVQNLDHTYTLSATERGYLVGLGVAESQLDAWLAEMNATRYSAPPSSRHYLEQYANPTGKIKTPVLTMNTAIDTLILTNHAPKYAATVAAAGRSGFLRQWYTTGDDHCEFTSAQIAAAVDSLDEWVATGAAPLAPPTFVAGFLPGFVAPPWPQP